MGSPYPVSDIVRDPDIIRHQRILRTAFDDVCKAAGVHQGDGPAMAYFDAVDPQHRYVYVSYSMGGEKPQGQPMRTDPNIGLVLAESIKFFRGWLQPHRTLVWRERPVVDVNTDNDHYASYWRCVQLADDAKQINIVWNF